MVVARGQVFAEVGETFLFLCGKTMENVLKRMFKLQDQLTEPPKDYSNWKCTIEFMFLDLSLIHFI